MDTEAIKQLAGDVNHVAQTAFESGYKKGLAEAGKQKATLLTACEEIKTLFANCWRPNEMSAFIIAKKAILAVKTRPVTPIQTRFGWWA